MPQRRTPVELRILDGTYIPAAHGPLPDETPHAIPRPPAWLREEAKQFWDQFIVELKPVLRESDGTALAAACEYMCHWLKMNREVAKMRANDRGRAARVAMMNSTWDKAYRLLAQFGMTPSDRSRLRFEAMKPNTQTVPVMPKSKLSAPKAKHG